MLVLLLRTTACLSMQCCSATAQVFLGVTYLSILATFELFTYGICAGVDQVFGSKYSLPSVPKQTTSTP